MGLNNDFLEEEENQDKIYPIDYDPNLVGINGAFSLIIIWLLISMILAVITIISNLSFLGKSGDIDMLVYIYSAAIFVIDIILSVVILILIFKYNILFRQIWVLQAVLMLFCNVLDCVSVGLYSSYVLVLCIDFIITIAGIVYLYQSERVKNTFFYSKNMKYKSNESNTYV